MIFLYGIAACALTDPLFAQKDPCILDGSQGAASWSHVPQAPGRDTVSAEFRKAQDEYFSTNYPLNVPYLDPDELRGSWIRETASAPPAYHPDRYWIVGTFLGYDVHEVTGKTIYTDMHIRVDRLVDNHQDKPNAPLVGSIVDAGAGGGCLITESGAIHGRVTQPEAERLQPGHRYLIELARTGVNRLYEMGAKIDLTSGKAEPLTTPDIKAAKAGIWPYHGLDEDAVIKRHKQENFTN